MKQYGICLNCGNDYVYYDNQSTGKFCSNVCQGEYSVKSRLRTGTTMNQAMRKYFNKILGDHCECGQGRIWNGKPLTLQLDHRNGDITDNRPENVRLICPNCHTQTDNWGVKNISEDGKLRLSTNGYNKHK